MAVVLPLMATRGPSAMTLGQAAIALLAIAVCVAAAGPLKFAASSADGSRVRGPRPADVIRFGFVQLAATVGLNAAGWWVAALVARSDISLAQAGLYAVALQLRNICSMPAGLVSQTAYAQLTDRGSQQYGGATRVTILSTIVATGVALLVIGPIAALMPWLVTHLYGRSFAGTELAATLAVATGLIHMSAAPAASRLTVVSLPLTGIINGSWSVLLVGLGSWMVPGGGAASATLGFLLAHLFSAVAVLVALIRADAASRDLLFSTLPAIAGSILIATLGWVRAVAAHKAAASLAILFVTAVLLGITFYQGRKVSTTLRRITPATIASNLWTVRDRLWGRGTFQY